MNGVVIKETIEYRYHINQNSSVTLDEYINNDVSYVVIPQIIDGYRVTEISEFAFVNQKSILGILFPDSITKIADKAFFGCSNLKMICFGKGIKWIGNEAFAECHSLENLKIPVVLDYLGEYAFSMCGLKHIEILGIKEWKSKSFALCTVLKSFCIKQCNLIPEYAFMHDILLSNVIVENHVEKICDNAFWDCRSFKQIAYDSWNYSIKDELIIEIENSIKKVEDLEVVIKKNKQKYNKEEKRKDGNLDCNEDSRSKEENKRNIEENVRRDIEKEIVTKIFIDMDKFDDHYKKENLDGFINCFKLLRDCGLPEEISGQYNEIVTRIEKLKNDANNFKKVYDADLSIFIENYFPETLNLSVGYIEYVNARVSADILESTQKEIVQALDTLLIGINDKIEEIQRFATIEIRAAAKALNAMMNADGFVDSEFKIN